ncbi:hypothetical protein TNCV_1301231 [Trichonephila clavipes]|nr:hypothetical protein TNCV_1301231 [Trichonephila clavipes]
MQVSPVPASDEVCPHVFFDLVAMRCVPSCEKCWMQVSPVPASDEVCPPVCASYEMCSRVSSTNLKCIMAFLLRERKDLLLEVPKELRVEIDITLPKIEFKKRICQSKYYDEESVKCLLEGIWEEKREEREKREIKKLEERKLIREFELQRLRAQLSNKLNENKLKAGNRINDLANVCVLSENRTTEVSAPVNKCRPLTLQLDRTDFSALLERLRKWTARIFLPSRGRCPVRGLINPVVNKSVENATSCDFEKENCDPPVRWTNVSPLSEVSGRGTEQNNLFKIVEGKEFNVYRNSNFEVKMKAVLCEGRVRTVAMGAQRGFVNGILETGGVMDKCVQMWTRNYGALGRTARVCFGVGQVCPDVDKELWRLGPDGSGVFWRVMRQ